MKCYEKKKYLGQQRKINNTDENSENIRQVNKKHTTKRAKKKGENKITKRRN